jgi:sodium/proline symporter
MDKITVVAVTLALYKLLLIGIGFWAQSRTRDEEDFFLGGRQLGPLVAAISYSSSASSAWTLLGLSGLAFMLGISVIWIVLGSIIGMLVTWFWIAPRLMAHSRKHNQITLTEFLADDSAGPMRRSIVTVASIIVIFCFTFYVAAQFQGAGNTFASTFELSMTRSVVIGAVIILVYTLLGGFWAVSVTDTVQGLLMAFTALVLPLAALIEVGGFGGFVDGLAAASSPEQLSWTGRAAGQVAAGVIVGGLCIGFGTYGQPHLLVRFMALRDEKALRQARWITIAWFAVVFFGMYFLGLVGHVLVQTLDNPETVFFVLTDRLFPPLLSAVLIAAVLSAIMSTADSQLLVAASAIAHDLGHGRDHPKTIMLISRLTVTALVILAVLVALYLDESIFSRVLFAWIALGSAFGPTVFMRLSGASLRPGGVLLSILLGFSLAVTFYLLPNTPGDIVERLLPFSVGLGVLFLSRRKVVS